MQALEQAFGKASTAISEQVQCCLEQLSNLNTTPDAPEQPADEPAKLPDIASHALNDLQHDTGSAGSGQLLGVTTHSAEGAHAEGSNKAAQQPDSARSVVSVSVPLSGGAANHCIR